MVQAYLHIPKEVHKAMWKQLLPHPLRCEEACFMFAKHRTEGEVEIFEYVDWNFIPSSGFSFRSCYHFELTNKTRANVIKRAHDLGTSLVELHSHDGNWPATFSPSDLLGFQEFVPHVWWRLKHKPYLALVVTRTSFDAITWLTDPLNPQYLDGIVIEGSVLSPTKLSPLRYKAYD